MISIDHDLVLLASDTESAQRQLDALATVAAQVGLVIITKKTQVLTVPPSLRADTELHSTTGAVVTLLRTGQFCYRSVTRDRVPNASEDLLQCKGLAWAAQQAFLQSDALPDSLNG